MSQQQQNGGDMSLQTSSLIMTIMHTFNWTGNYKTTDTYCADLCFVLSCASDGLLKCVQPLYAVCLMQDIGKKSAQFLSLWMQSFCYQSFLEWLLSTCQSWLTSSSISDKAVFDRNYIISKQILPTFKCIIAGDATMSFDFQSLRRAHIISLHCLLSLTMWMMSLLRFLMKMAFLRKVFLTF